MCGLPLADETPDPVVHTRIQAVPWYCIGDLPVRSHAGSLRRNVRDIHEKPN